MSLASCEDHRKIFKANVEPRRKNSSRWNLRASLFLRLFLILHSHCKTPGYPVSGFYTLIMLSSAQKLQKFRGKKKSKCINLAFKTFNNPHLQLSTIPFHTINAPVKTEPVTFSVVACLATSMLNFSSTQKASPTQHFCKIKYLSVKIQTDDHLFS